MHLGHSYLTPKIGLTQQILHEKPLWTIYSFLTFTFLGLSDVYFLKQEPND